MWIIDCVPIILGTLAALLGFQRELARVLLQRERDTQAIFDSISDPIFITDLKGCILRQNQAASIGEENGQRSLLGRRFSELLGLDPSAWLAATCRQPGEVEWLGKIFTCRVHLISTASTDQPVFLTVLHDVSEPRRKAREADWQKQFYEAVGDQQPGSDCRPG